MRSEARATYSTIQYYPIFSSHVSALFLQKKALQCPRKYQLKKSARPRPDKDIQIHLDSGPVDITCGDVQSQRKSHGNRTQITNPHLLQNNLSKTLMITDINGLTSPFV